MAEDQRNESTDVSVSIAGQKVEDDKLHSLVVDQDQNQPDMCILSLNNEGHTFSEGTSHGDAVEVKIGSTAIFKGEVVGIEPHYKSGGESKCIVRAYNRLHRLLRGRKSRTFLKQKDSDIASTIAGDAGLTAQATDTKIKHDHVYQHNQTNLEFLRVRAARNGFEVRVEDTKLIFDKRKVDETSDITLELESEDETKALAFFAARMSSAGMVNKVTCRGWDPEAKEEIVGEASASSSKLGSKPGYKAASAFGSPETYEVDHPVFSADEAKAIAQGRLDDMLMNYITGEAGCKGNAGIKPGIVITIKVDNNATNKFNGKYFVAGATHTYSFTKDDGGGAGGGGGYRTLVRVRRDAEGG